MGSSPLARGLREDGAQGLDGDRIIPARAGFTSGDRPVLTAAPDHPRSRGVYGSTPLRTNTALGSSPLARGLHRARRPPGRPQRIIPARAGFTRPGIGLSGTRKDHPRSRGVYTPHTLRRTLATGSSPLARGLPSLVGSLADAGRIIPARAGFTGCDAPGSRVPQDHPRSRGVYTGGWLHEMDILSDALTHEDPDEQVRTALARLDPTGDMIGERDARSWLRDMRHALRRAWRSSTYRTAIGHIAAVVDGGGYGATFGYALL